MPVHECWCHSPPLCRYHLLKPEYIHHRIRELQRSFRLRIILCHVDTEDAVEPLAQASWFCSVSTRWSRWRPVGWCAMCPKVRRTETDV